MVVLPMMALNGMYFGYIKFFKPLWLQYKMQLAEAEGQLKDEKEPTESELLM